MKRSPRWLLPVALAALAAVTMTACSTGSAGSSSGQAAATATANVAADGALSGKKVLYIDAAPGNALLDGLAQGLAIDLAAQGADVARVFQLNAQNQIDLAAANQRINEGIAQDVDAIVIFPLDANAVGPGVQAAKDAGIPVFIFQDISSIDATGKVAFPDEARGKSAGEALAEAAGGTGTATVLSGLPTDNIEDAVRGGLAGLESGGMTLVGDPNNQRNLDDDAPGGQAIAQAIFQNHPDLTALLVYNSASATGAIAAARQAGLEDTVLIGTMAGEDTNITQLQDGTLTVSYDLNGLEYGSVMADLVTRSLTGDVAEGTVVEAPEGSVFTSENAAEFVPWTERVEYIDIPSTF
jgi:ribose transport system substrate-binding protein